MNHHTYLFFIVNSIINMSYWNWRQDHFFEATVCFVHCICSIWMLSKIQAGGYNGFL